MEYLSPYTYAAEVLRVPKSSKLVNAGPQAGTIPLVLF